MEDAAKQAFLPEFINRIDEIVTFDVADPGSTSSGSRAQMVAPRGRPPARRARRSRSASTTSYIAQLARDGFDEAYGARPLQRHIRRTLEKALTKAILAGEIADGDHVYAHADGSLTVDVHEHALAA